MLLEQQRQAFVLRIAPSGIDRAEEALRDSEATIGWADARELLNPDLEWAALRNVLRRRYYPDEATARPTCASPPPSRHTPGLDAPFAHDVGESHA